MNQRLYQVSIFFSWIIAVCMCCSATAQPSEKSEQDARAIRASIESYVAVLNERKYDLLDDYWVKDGDLVDAGGRAFQVGELARQEQVKTSASEQPPLHVSIEKIRLITSNTAIVDGTLSRASDATTHFRFTSVHLKQDGKWLIAGVREAGQAPVQGDAELKQLEWLVGDWVGTNDQSTIHSSIRWSQNEHFLVRRFTVREKGDITLSGIHRMGWDPRSQQLKSWYFDSEGNVGNGIWSKQGDHWIVHVEGALHDGTPATSTSIFTVVDHNSFLHRSFNIRIGDLEMPDREVRVVRQEAGE